MKRGGRFARRLTAAVVAVTVLALVTLGWLLVDVNERALHDRNRELLLAVTDDAAHATTATLDGGHRALIQVASVLGNSALSSSDRLSAARTIVAVSPVDVVAIYDETGARVDAIVHADPKWEGPKVLDAKLRDDALANGLAYAPVETVGDRQIVVAVAPVRGAGATWYAATDLSLAPLSERLADIGTGRFGDAGAVFVVDSSLAIIVHGDPEIAARHARSPVALADAVEGEALTTGGVLAYREVEGPDGAMVVLIRSLPGLPWAVVAMTPKASAYASIASMRRTIIIVVLATVVVAALASLLLARRIASPVRRLVALVGDLGKRKFDVRHDITTGDELETLGDALQGAAADLAHSEAQLRDEAAIRQDLGRYLPARLAERVAKREHDMVLGGERRTVTILFADVVAFTSLAEREPADKVAALLNQLFTILTEIVFKHGGTVDKFVGDSVMAIWNAPDDQADHASRAVAAAMDMQRWMEPANECWQATNGLTLQLAIGIHTGDAIVGNLGSETRMEYTCIGDAVNVAARLETLAGAQQILISEATKSAAGGALRTLRLGPHRLRGRHQLVEVHEVVP